MKAWIQLCTGLLQVGPSVKSRYLLHHNRSVLLNLVTMKKTNYHSAPAQCHVVTALTALAPDVLDTIVAAVAADAHTDQLVRLAASCQTVLQCVLRVVGVRSVKGLSLYRAISNAKSSVKARVQLLQRMCEFGNDLRVGCVLYPRPPQPQLASEYFVPMKNNLMIGLEELNGELPVIKDAASGTPRDIGRVVKLSADFLSDSYLEYMLGTYQRTARIQRGTTSKEVFEQLVKRERERRDVYRSVSIAVEEHTNSAKPTVLEFKNARYNNPCRESVRVFADVKKEYTYEENDAYWWVSHRFVYFNVRMPVEW